MSLAEMPRAIKATNPEEVEDSTSRRMTLEATPGEPHVPGFRTAVARIFSASSPP
jgi:hypothetical protein